MALAPNTENYLLGRGKIYFGKFDADGVSTGLLDLGNAPAFNISIETDKLDHFSSRSGLKTKDKSVILEVTPSVSFTLDEINIENLKLAFLGDTVAFTQTSGSAASQAVTCIEDRFVSLGYIKVSNVVVKDVTDTTTYVFGTDYTIDADAGLLMALGTGSIVDGDVLHVSFDYAAVTSQTITGVTSPKTTGSLLFVGSPAAGAAYKAEFWSVDLVANGDIGFITESDWAQMQFTASVTKDEIGHPTSPYFSVTKIA